MPSLDNDRKFTRVVLPVASKPDDEAWVEVYEDVVAADLLDLQGFAATKDYKGAANSSITNLIHAWNFVEKDGTPTPLLWRMYANSNLWIWSLSSMPPRDLIVSKNSTTQKKTTNPIFLC